MRNKYIKSSFFNALILSLLFGYVLHAQCPKLVWADEFNGAELNASNWSYQIGDGCDINLCQWGNSELQWYTSNKENVSVSDGTLKLIARKQTVQNRNYTSARIRTIQKVDIKFGRIEARMKLPIGQGIWPAFWMLPTDNVYGAWPTSGELDIMEYLGHEADKIHGTIHFGNPWPNNASSTASFVLQNSTFNAAFHDYALEWSDQDIKWFIDGYLYSTKTRSAVGSLKWPFDQKFHFLFNLAVGGNWPGAPNSGTVFPQTFEIDFIRVYDLVNQPYIEGMTKVPPGEKNLSYSLNNVPANSTIEWSLPSGAKLINGQGTGNILVDWGNSSGNILVHLKSPCTELDYTLAVALQPVLAKDISLENYDLNARITKTSSTGALTEDVPNPASNAINESKLCGKYIRNAAAQYDVLVYDISDVKFGADFVSGEKKFNIDIFSMAPKGTQILLQLENKSTANASNYPTGRHSRYSTITTKQNEWERLSFEFLDRPSTSVGDFDITQLILLFAPNSLTGATYYIDNFDIYSRTTVPLLNSMNPGLIQIFPSPAGNQLNIQYKGSQHIDQIMIYDSLGRWVNNVDGNNSNSIKIKSDHLSQGLYHVRIKFSGGLIMVNKFLKL